MQNVACNCNDFYFFVLQLDILFHNYSSGKGPLTPDWTRSPKLGETGADFNLFQIGNFSCHSTMQRQRTERTWSAACKCHRYFFQHYNLCITA